MLTLIASILFSLVAPNADAPKSADELADAVFKASGGENWDKVKTIKFTFGGARTHEWDVKNHLDKVTMKDKSGAGKTIEVNVSHKPADKEHQQAYGAWVNDTYWLLAPLKVNDPGVKRSLKPDEQIDGKTYHVLHLSFDHVGMTPSDQYNFYVDPETNLVRAWDYIGAGKDPSRMSWDDYQDYSGLKLSSTHKTKRGELKLTDITVVAE